jgi:hypothetical protein
MLDRRIAPPLSISELAEGAGMTARLTSAQDNFVGGVEIELPLDDESARVLTVG